MVQNNLKWYEFDWDNYLYKSNRLVKEDSLIKDKVGHSLNASVDLLYNNNPTNLVVTSGSETAGFYQVFPNPTTFEKIVIINSESSNGKNTEAMVGDINGYTKEVANRDRNLTLDTSDMGPIAFVVHNHISTSTNCYGWKITKDGEEQLLQYGPPGSITKVVSTDIPNNKMVVDGGNWGLTADPGRLYSDYNNWTGGFNNPIYSDVLKLSFDGNENTSISGGGAPHSHGLPLVSGEFSWSGGDIPFNSTVRIKFGVGGKGRPNANQCRIEHGGGTIDIGGEVTNGNTVEFVSTRGITSPFKRLTLTHNVNSFDPSFCYIEIDGVKLVDGVAIEDHVEYQTNGGQGSQVKIDNNVAYLNNTGDRDNRWIAENIANNDFFATDNTEYTDLGVDADDAVFTSQNLDSVPYNADPSASVDLVGRIWHIAEGDTEEQVRPENAVYKEYTEDLRVAEGMDPGPWITRPSEAIQNGKYYRVGVQYIDSAGNIVPDFVTYYHTFKTKARDPYYPVSDKINVVVSDDELQLDGPGEFTTLPGSSLVMVKDPDDTQPPVPASYKLVTTDIENVDQKDPSSVSTVYVEGTGIFNGTVASNQPLPVDPTSLAFTESVNIGSGGSSSGGDVRLYYVKLPTESFIGFRRNNGGESGRMDVLCYWNGSDWIVDDVNSSTTTSGTFLMAKTPATYFVALRPETNISSFVVGQPIPRNGGTIDADIFGYQMSSYTFTTENVDFPIILTFPGDVSTNPDLQYFKSGDVVMAQGGKKGITRADSKLNCVTSIPSPEQFYNNGSATINIKSSCSGTLILGLKLLTPKKPCFLLRLVMFLNVIKRQK